MVCTLEIVVPCGPVMLKSSALKLNVECKGPSTIRISFACVLLVYTIPFPVLPMLRANISAFLKRRF